MSDIDHNFTDEIICPWCGEVHGDSWEWPDDSGRDDCQQCGKPFEWSRNVSVDYSTEKIKPMLDAEPPDEQKHIKGDYLRDEMVDREWEESQ